MSSLSSFQEPELASISSTVDFCTISCDWPTASSTLVWSVCRVWFFAVRELDSSLQIQSTGGCLVGRRQLECSSDSQWNLCSNSRFFLNPKPQTLTLVDLIPADSAPPWSVSTEGGWRWLYGGVKSTLKALTAPQGGAARDSEAGGLQQRQKKQKTEDDAPAARTAKVQFQKLCSEDTVASNRTPRGRWGRVQGEQRKGKEGNCQALGGGKRGDRRWAGHFFRRSPGVAVRDRGRRVSKRRQRSEERGRKEETVDFLHARRQGEVVSFQDDPDPEGSLQEPFSRGARPGFL